MRLKEKDAEKVARISEATLLSLVASKLKGRLLFPERVEECKKTLSKVKFSEL